MPTQKLQMYVCSVCGNMVEVVGPGAGTLVCCGIPMNLLAENAVDAAQEKHVPVIAKVEGGVEVRVGSVPHPMEEKHRIEWIEVITDSKSYRQFLEPNEPPQAVFPVEGDRITAREYCNLHGLWRGE